MAMVHQLAAAGKSYCVELECHAVCCNILLCRAVSAVLSLPCYAAA